MHAHAERGNDQVAGAVNDRSSRSAWECRQGRSAFRFWEGDAERHGKHYHAERGNDHVAGAVNDRSSRSRVGMPPGTLRVPLLRGDAERHGMHAHAERGNDQVAGAVNDRSSRSRVGMPPGTLRVPLLEVKLSVTGCMSTQSVGPIESTPTALPTPWSKRPKNRANWHISLPTPPP